MASFAPAIVGLAETGNTRHPPEGQDTLAVLAEALTAVLDDVEISPSEVDGLVLSSFTLGADKAGDVAWRLGLSLRWVVDLAPAGAAPIASLGLAMRAIQAGDASVIVLLAGECRDRAAMSRLPEYNRAREENLGPLGFSGPNSLFAMLTVRQMRALGLSREDYGSLVIGQRRWASRNPAAAYREPLSMDEYLNAPIIADPLGRYDCPPFATGANALVLTTEDRCPRGRRPIRIRALTQCYNVDNQAGDGLRTGLAAVRDSLWEQAALGPRDMDLASLYDDYPAVVIAQLIDLGLAEPATISSFIREQVMTGDFPVNTAGGLLSAGQAGGGLQGTVEVVRQLQGRAGDRQVPGARLGVAAGYGQVLYRYGSASSAVVLEGAG